MSELDYVSQTLAKAVLALGRPGGIAERMKSAHREWHPITADKVPAELRKKWQSIIDRLTVVKDDEQGHVPATIDSLSDDDLNDLAMDIMDFAARVNRFY